MDIPYNKIDPSLHELISTLNKYGLITTGCCAGHIYHDPEEHGGSIYPEEGWVSISLKGINIEVHPPDKGWALEDTNPVLVLRWTLPEELRGKDKLPEKTSYGYAFKTEDQELSEDAR